MAQFKNKLYTGEVVDPGKQLLLAVTLWIRTMESSVDGEIGLHNLVRLLVPHSNDLYFGDNVPAMPANKLIVSDGTVYEIYGLKHSLVWNDDSAYFRLTKHWIDWHAKDLGIHKRWMYWAFATALGSLDKTGGYPIHKPKPVTLGGWEVANFEDL